MEPDVAADLPPAFEQFTLRTPLAPPEEDGLHPLFVLLVTLLTAGVLSFFLLGTSSDQKRPPSKRQDEDEEYFQKIVADVKLDSWSGQAQGCSWTQTDDEVELTSTLPPEVKARDVVCKVLPGSIALSARGKSIVQGTLFRKVRHDEVDWAIEERGGERILRVTLGKVIPTKGAQHWTSLVLEPDL